MDYLEQPPVIGRTELTMNFSEIEFPAVNVTNMTREDDMHAAVVARISMLLAQARQLWGVRMSQPTVDFRLRGGPAGKAHLQRGHLQFNAALLRANRDHFLHQTVGHEVAHLVTYALYGARAKPHGAEWKKIMRELGLDTRATHDYDVTGLRRTRSPFIYACGCDTEIRVGALRHKRAARGAVYTCRRCTQRIVYLHTCA